MKKHVVAVVLAAASVGSCSRTQPAAVADGVPAADRAGVERATAAFHQALRTKELETFMWALQPASGGAAVVDRGNYMHVWKRQSDKTWRFAREVYNSASPP